MNSLYLYRAGCGRWTLRLKPDDGHAVTLARMRSQVRANTVLAAAQRLQAQGHIVTPESLRVAAWPQEPTEHY